MRVVNPRLSLGIITVLLFALAAGCGSSSSKSTTSAHKGPSPIQLTGGTPSWDQAKGKESLAQFESLVTQTAADAASGKCGPVATFASQRNFHFPCTPGKPQSGFAHFKVVGVAKYGTGVALEFRDAETAAMHARPTAGFTPKVKANTGVWPVSLESNGHYVYMSPGPPPALDGPPIGTAPNGWSTADANAIAFVKAIRDGNCQAFFKYSLTPTGMSAKQACALGLHREYQPLLEDLNTGRPATLSHMGANGFAYFYGLQVNGHHGTIGLMRSGQPSPAFLVVGAIPSP